MQPPASLLRRATAQVAGAQAMRAFAADCAELLQAWVPALAGAGAGGCSERHPAALLRALAAETAAAAARIALGARQPPLSDTP